MARATIGRLGLMQGCREESFTCFSLAIGCRLKGFRTLCNQNQLVIMNNIGKRICIIGPSCAGKSTLAKKLGEKLHLPILHLDQISHIPGTNWAWRPRSVVQREHDEFIQKDEWIVDGQYLRLLPQRIERADTVILLEVNRFVSVWRFFKRHFNGGNWPGKLENASDRFDFEMAWWIFYHQPRRWKEQIQIISNYPHVKKIPLKGFRAINKFFTTL